MRQTHYPNLDIPDCKLALCRIWEYSISHSQLVIRVAATNVEEWFYITFTGVRYVQAPMGWRGADFRITNGIEVQKLLNKIEIDEEAPLVTYHLFEVQGGKVGHNLPNRLSLRTLPKFLSALIDIFIHRPLHIRIIALDASVFQTNDPLYKMSSSESSNTQ